ncbi:MAG: HAD family hydrolase [Archaeoglobaceae archaeon]
MRTVIFDLDNTLVEFVNAKRRACEEVAKLVGSDGEELFSYFLRGKGFESCENIADYLKDRGVYSEELYEVAAELYEETKLRELKVYDGVFELLEELKKRGLKLCVVTDADRENAERRLRKAGIIGYFDLIVTFDDTGRKKPDPAPLELALRKLGCRPEDAILVGDSGGRDVEAGKKLGITTVHATYGCWKIEECRADFSISSPLELLEIIEGKKEKR